MFFARGHLKRADIDRMAIFDSLKILEWDTAKKNCSNFVLTVCVLVFSHLWWVLHISAQLVGTVQICVLVLSPLWMSVHIYIIRWYCLVLWVSKVRLYIKHLLKFCFCCSDSCLCFIPLLMGGGYLHNWLGLFGFPGLGRWDCTSKDLLKFCFGCLGSFLGFIPLMSSNVLTNEGLCISA